MTPRIMFVVMSAVHSAEAVAELARALAPHTVLIHHDFAQTPLFPVSEPNASFVPTPKRTGWACWGFSEGIFHSLEHALAHHDFDYLQLLSPTCLPIKPIRAFEEYVSSSGLEANLDSLDLFDDFDALMSVGYRAFAPERTLRHRLLRRLSWEYYGGGAFATARPAAGVRVWTRTPPPGEIRLPLSAWAARLAMTLAAQQRLGRHIFTTSFRPRFGSVWFGARREVVRRMVEIFHSPGIQEYFRGLWIADEFLVPTLLWQTGVCSGPSNHMVSNFTDARPDWFEERDVESLIRSKAFFARKFRDDPNDRARRRILDETVLPSPVGRGVQTRTGMVGSPSA